MLSSLKHQQHCLVERALDTLMIKQFDLILEYGLKPFTAVGGTVWLTLSQTAVISSVEHIG